MSQKLNSDNLSGNPVPNEDDILLEYQNAAGKETRESSNISNQSDQFGNAAKAGEIDKAENTIDQNIEGAQNAYSNPGSTSNPNVIIYPVLKSSYEDMQEDLKNYAGKVKPAKEINHLNRGTQMVSAQFEDANQKTSQFVNMIINAIKKIGELRVGIVGKMKDGGGKKTVLNILLVICIVAVLAVGGLRLLNPKTDSPIPSSSGASQPENNPLELVLVTPGSGGSQTGGNPLELVLITPPAFECSIRFTNPIGIAQLPNFGPMLFEWTDVPSASSYVLKVAPPAETSLPWGYAVQENSKNIYMENFPMGGEFSVSIHALSSSGKILCAATLRYSKQEYVRQSGGAQNNEGQSGGSQNNEGQSEETNGAEPASTPCTLTGIGYFCP